jgi:hypothetical protein
MLKRYFNDAPTSSMREHPEGNWVRIEDINVVSIGDKIRMVYDLINSIADEKKSATISKLKFSVDEILRG